MYIRSLTNTQKKALYEIMRKSEDYSMRKKAHLTLLSYKKYSLDNLAELFDINVFEVIQHIKEWKKRGVLSLKKQPNKLVLI